MWVIYAFASAVFAGLTSIFAKVGVKNTDSHLLTALRTIIVLIFAWLMVFVVGSQTTISEISMKSLGFLVLSGITTGSSWICYFKALQLGDVNKVVPIDKSSIILTMLLALIFLREALTINKVIAILTIAIGTYLMIQKKEMTVKIVSNQKWLIYALLSALFAGLTSILGKVGIEGVESNLGTAIRTIVVFIMAWLIVFGTGKQLEIKNIDRRSWLFIGLSGLATGFSWLFYYRALQLGEASIVVPIDKLSIVITVTFAYIFFKEKLSKRSLAGLIMIVLGTLVLLVKI